MILQDQIYVKKSDTVLVNTDNKFVYEVQVFCYFKNYCGLVNRKYYSSNIEIPYVVSDFFKNPNTKISSSLLSAPLKWLLENGFQKYVKPDKKLIVKKVKTKKDGKSKIATDKQRSWRLDGETDST